MDMELKVKSFAPWVGSNSEKQIIEAILHHVGSAHAYWEVFCGGGSVFLAKTPSRQETINDLHPGLINMLGTLASARYEELLERLNRTPFIEQNVGAALDYIESHKPESIATPFVVSDEQLEWAYAHFVLWWSGKGGIAGGPQEGQVSIRMDSKGGAMPSRFRSAIESISWLHARLERVGIYNRDAFELLETIEDARGTVIYADPTFIQRDHLYHYALRTRRGGLFDNAGDDHDRLAGLLRRFKKTKVVLRYYSDPRLDDLYPESWARVDCTRNKRSAGNKKDGAPDLLLVNRP